MTDENDSLRVRVGSSGLGMVFDLHIHTSPGSGDSFIPYNDLVPWARHAGLDGICITEHGWEKTGVAERLSREYDFVILEGIEVSTDLGDILVYGVDGIPKNLHQAAELRQFVIQKGGVMFAAHPFRSQAISSIDCESSTGLSVADGLRYPILGLVDGLEVANGWCVPEHLAFCQAVCERAGLKGIGGSDAHLSHQIGCCVTVFENSIYCEADLVTELKRGTFHAEDRRH